MSANDRPLKDDLEQHSEEVRRIVSDTARDVVAELQEVSGKALARVTEKTSRLSTPARVGVGLGAALVGVAGLAAIGAARSRTDRNRRLVYHLEPGSQRAWRLRLEGEEACAEFDTKKEGLAAGRELAAEHAPSELVVHRADGTEQDRHVYSSEDSA